MNTLHAAYICYMQKEIVVSGIRPTGFLHLGNYFGAMRNYLRMQDDYTSFFFVANWHALTTHTDAASIAQSVQRVIAEYIACGLDPEKAILYVQSDIPEIAELYLLLNMLAYKGELEKTASFKEKIRKHTENINAGLLTYPVLMAADILIHKAVKVPVGKDQEQHLEMVRNFAHRFNHRYGNCFPEPHPFNFGNQLTKILSLDGQGKMSKSEHELATVYLVDEDEVIRKKIMKAKTDAGPGTPNTPKPDYIENLFVLMRLVSTPEAVQYFENAYNNCAIRYGDMKKQLAEDMVQFIAPIRTKAAAIQKDTTYISAIRKIGSEKARANASKTIQEVRKKMMGLS